jgi:predicted dehydrogenase
MSWRSFRSRPKTFKNYHDLLEMKGLEAVFIGTIPHWHALQFIAACEKGLDIYCEKPLAYDIKEGLAMINAANKAGNIVQVGFQRREAGSFKKAKEIIESGRIGEVHQISARIHYNPTLQDTRIQPPPASLDWEEWCGPAPKLDYRPNIGHVAWRLGKEYGNGHR